MNHILIPAILSFQFLSAYGGGIQILLLTCRFSADGQYALVYELKNISIKGQESPLFGFFKPGQNDHYDSVVIQKDSVYFVKQLPGSYSFDVIKASLLSDFINKYELTIAGIDYSKEIEAHIDSDFVRKGLPLRDGHSDTFCVERNFYNFYISYILSGIVLYSDTILSTNTSSSRLLEIIKQTEKIPQFNEDSAFIGYLGYGTKVFCDKTLTSIFIRTKYITAEFQSKWYSHSIEIIDPETKEPRQIETKGETWGRDEKHIRMLIKKSR